MAERAARVSGRRNCQLGGCQPCVHSAFCQYHLEISPLERWQLMQWGHCSAPPDSATVLSEMGQINTLKGHLVHRTDSSNSPEQVVGLLPLLLPGAILTQCFSRESGPSSEEGGGAGEMRGQCPSRGLNKRHRFGSDRRLFIQDLEAGTALLNGVTMCPQ